jgi:glycosyltransferase involved in cell wall biosynthesis
MRTEQPLISVILCFFNEERFLSESVQSVLNQTYSNWELILVDDGSTDGSVGIAKELSLNYSSIKYVDHENHSNRGLSASRNAGVKVAQGEFIAVIDADDVWLPQKLEVQLDLMFTYPKATVLLEPSLYWYSWNNKLAKDVLIPVGAAGNAVYEPPKLMLQLYPLGAGSAPCPSGIFCKRSVFERSLFEESYRGIYQMYEDQAFLCKLYLRENILVSSVCNNWYRQRPASLVSAVYETGKYDVVRKYYLDWFTEFYKKEGVVYPEVEHLLKQALFPYVQPKRYFWFVTIPRKIKRRVVRVLVMLGLLHYPKK